jgi:hypothetical protein
MVSQENEQTQLLREILKWIKFAGMKELKSTLLSVLDTDVKKFVYQKSDGTNGSVELAKLAGIGSNKTVANMWNEWLKLSLGENIPVRGGSRFKRSFDLDDFGIGLPELPQKTSQESEKKEQKNKNSEASK